MNVLWARHPGTAVEVAESLPEGHGWKQKTVNTFLTRLVDKGVLKVTRQGKANLYEPLLQREDCIANESDSFLNRVFQGATGSLVMHFCERADLTPAEIHELEQMLKTKKVKR